MDPATCILMPIEITGLPNNTFLMHWSVVYFIPPAIKTIRQDVLSRREIQIAQILGTISQSNQTEQHSDSATTGSKNLEAQKSEFGANPISDWWVNEHFKSGLLKKGEQLTFSPEDPQKESTLDKADNHWKQRIDTNKADILLQVRNTMTSMAALLRHHRSLV